VRGMR